MRKTKVLALALMFGLAATMTSFAGEWQQGETGYKYQNDDGSFPASTWQLIDGQWYYFHNDGIMAYDTWIDDYYLGSNGAMLTNTVTPDGQRVGADGKLIKPQSVSNISYSADSVTTDLLISDWAYESYGTTRHIFEITNNSPYTISVSINETAKDGNGNPIGAHSTEEGDIPSGCTVFAINYLSDVAGVAGFDTVIQTKQEKYYIPVIQNIALETTNLGDKVLVKATNNGDTIADFVEATAVFYNGDKVVDYRSTYLVDDDCELKPGASISEQINYYNFSDVTYDSVRVHITGRRSVWD